MGWCIVAPTKRCAGGLLVGSHFFLPARPTVPTVIAASQAPFPEACGVGGAAYVCRQLRGIWLVRQVAAHPVSATGSIVGKVERGQSRGWKSITLGVSQIVAWGRAAILTRRSTVHFAPYQEMKRYVYSRRIRKMMPKTTQKNGSWNSKL